MSQWKRKPRKVDIRDDVKIVGAHYAPRDGDSPTCLRTLVADVTAI